jgi:hypothetical protein
VFAWRPPGIGWDGSDATRGSIARAFPLEEKSVTT